MPTRYDLKMRIFYTYGLPTGLGRHIVRVEPLDLPGRQRVSLRHLAVRPRPAERQEGSDFFGNRLVDVAFDGESATQIEFRLHATVERISQRPGLDISPPVARLTADLASVRSLNGASPHHFTGASPRIGAEPDIAAWARMRAEPGMTAMETVTALGTALHEDMTFVPGATDVLTSPGAAFAQREGVCQDYAHILIVALRALGIPAGYVSGFLRTLPPEGEARLAGADAMHAWVRAWCGRELGWIEYDPTNAMAVGEDHIIVAYGRDYSDVSPVKGVTRMAGQGGTGHAVDVVELAAPGAR